ncbi:OsmC family protein [Reichenbachiella faecimaris]|uniref:OsmC family protein n=1 Tax=Reichenbachiella faecimaris TaxID=692418 RepID=UPI000A079777|nr:OsmC family protein [Reichenbachiella faecimaris]
MSTYAVAITKEELTTQLNTDGHMGLVDEPVEIGGLDKGPTPYDLLCGALASCTSITLRLYANRKEWDVSRIRVEVKYAKSYKEACETCDEKPQKVDTFERIISLEGNLDNDQKNRMLQIANSCPVHRTLESDILVETRLD